VHGPGIDVSGNGASFRDTTRLVGLVALVGRLAQDQVGNRLAPLGVTYAQAVTLVRLWRSESHSMLQRDLIDSLGVSRASGSEVLNQVEKLGLVRRSWDRGDARNRVVALTESGEDLERPVLEAFAAVERFLISEELSADRDTAIGVLRAMLANVKELRELKREVAE